MTHRSLVQSSALVFRTLHIKAALRYFGLVFGVGFVLGPIRILWLVPLVGGRTAELIEMPLMIAVTVVVAGWIIRHFNFPPDSAARFGIGLLALGFLVATEVGMTLAQGIPVAEYILNRDPISGMAYFIALGLMAFMPLFVSRR